MKDKLSFIAFFAMLIGFGVLATSLAIPNKITGVVAILLILPSITLNIAMQWINIGNIDHYVKEKISILSFTAMLFGFIALVTSMVIPNEKMGMVAMLLILPSITLIIAMRLINNGNEEYNINDK